MIGVAISTYDRRDLALDSIERWRKHLPQQAFLVVVDDASPTPFPDINGAAVIRHDYRRGVAMTKNTGIAALMDAGCDHLFLADDDCHPTVDDWWQPYVQSPEQHLSWQWETRPPWISTFDDGTHWAIGFPRGVLLYVTREVVDTVGGMDPNHLRHAGEHVVWQQRIHDAGFGAHPFMDAHGTSDRFWSYDREQGGTLGSTIPLDERRTLVQGNSKLWEHSIAKDFVPYREGVRGVQDRDYDNAPILGDRFEDTLDHVLAHKLPGVALEFGVGEGNSLRRISKRMFAYGFDTFAGLPERWRDGFDQGMFACEPPAIPNAYLVKGMVQDTIRHFDFDQAGHIGLIHLDFDLYSSTAAVLEGIEVRNLVDRVFHPGLVVVFDEMFGYPGFEAHEMKAWNEFADRTDISWTLIGRGPEQLALRII